MFPKRVEINTNYVGMVTYSDPQPRNSLAKVLKRWRVTEKRWNRKIDSRGSFDLALILHPSLEITEVADSLIALKFSNAIGWKR